MAKLQVGKGIDNYISQLQNLEHTAPEAIGAAIYKGAGIITDEVRKNIKAIPDTVIPPIQRQGLLDGLGITHSQNDNGYINVKVGFDGYNAQPPTKKHPKGKANAMIARSVEAGTSWRPKHPFIAPAIRSKREEAERAMAATLDEYINQQTEG